MINFKHCVALLTFSLLSTPSAFAEWTQEFALTLDSVNNLSGGIQKQSVVLGHVDASWAFENEKSSANIYFIADAGGSPSSIIGDLQGTNNIEAPSGIKLHEFWYQYDLSDTFHVLGGLYDFNSEFSALEYGGIFLNGSFGIGVDISQAGPSLFPQSAVAIRALKELPNDKYFLLGIFDGVPGHPEHEHSTRIHLNSTDGIFSSAEFGMATDFDSENYIKAAIGFWHHSVDTENHEGSSINSNLGIYMIAEKRFNEKLGGFIQYGWADDAINQVDTYLGMGINYSGLFNKEDTFGLGLAYAHISPDFIKFNADITDAETSIELSYTIPFNSHLTIHPDVQYIINPGADSLLDDAFVFTLRLEYSL